MSQSGSDLSEPIESFFNLSRDELSEALDPSFRSTQLYEAVYKHGIDDFERITNLPKSLRATLKARWEIRMPPIHKTFEAEDGTRRHLIRLGDGEMIETVIIPEGDRKTICVSSQVGCGLACTFCLTGQLGFARHLTAGEIVAQVLVAQREDRTQSFNIVLMGMGEPLHNYDNVMKALGILNDPTGMNLSMSRVTLSTVGLIPELWRLSGENLIPNLAVSLTGATDEIRNKLMPINRTYPINDLVAVLRDFSLKPRQQVTLEYVLLRGVTDSPDQAEDLALVAQRSRAKVNLIPLNESPDLDYKRPDQATVLGFQNILRDRGVRTFIRKSRGDDISAACGQLKKKWADSAPEIDLAALKI